MVLENLAQQILSLVNWGYHHHSFNDSMGSYPALLIV